MWRLQAKTETQFDADDIYDQLKQLYQGVAPTTALAISQALLLVLATHIGSEVVLQQAIIVAKNSLAPNLC